MPLADKTSRQIRSSFLEFFAQRGHEVVKSAPLVPENDPTLMFVNAGMVQFKDVFTGADVRPYKRAASSQKCIRISGKHNDLENVGVTARHHTFFEMLGNFSFGDYFKEDAIVFAWEYLTKVVDIPAERLVITIFKGEDGVPADEEAAAIWKKVTGFGDERIIRLGKDDNFWSMGDTGACGPCSEIHFFNGADVDVSRFGEEPRIDGMGWTEIWNLVFMQYNRAEKGGPLVALPAQSIDTGMGLERLSTVVQGVTSNYDTDCLRALVDLAASIAKKPYGGTLAPDDVSMRVIADHARTTAFLMAEGVMPERQKREYILRRVMRRAVRHGHRLGIERPFLHEVALAVIDLMKGAYPELEARRDLIARVTEDEEVRFRATLQRGLGMLDEHFGDLEKKHEKKLPDAVVADLYSTFGFPIDLTAVIGKERGFEVDIDKAQALVKGESADGPINPDAALDPIYHALRQELGETEFTGYEREDGESTIRAIVRVETSADGKETRTRIDRAEEGAHVEVIVAKTPFYAESGGQVGDIGHAVALGGAVEISDTQRPLAGLVVHVGKVSSGAIAVDETVQLKVSHAARSATRRNHSATHLLHWALRTVLGEHAQQKGSRVAPDMLRFDFAHNKPLQDDEIARIEDLVNEKILSNAPVVTEVLGIDEAKKRGAIAMFGEKYGERVRVLTMTRDSVEFCGGTHARALGDIGLFKIEGETGVAAGVRRVLATTGLNTLAAVRETDATMGRARAILKAQSGELEAKLTKLVKHEKELEKKVAELEKKVLEGGGSGVDGMLSGAKSIGDAKILGLRVADGTNAGALRELAEKLRDKLGERSAVMLAAIADGKVALSLMVSKALSNQVHAGNTIRDVAKTVGGSGGGRPDMAQAGGTDLGGVENAIATFYAQAEAALKK